MEEGEIHILLKDVQRLGVGGLVVVLGESGVIKVVIGGRISNFVFPTHSKGVSR